MQSDISFVREKVQVLTSGFVFSSCYVVFDEFKLGSKACRKNSKVFALRINMAIQGITLGRYFNSKQQTEVPGFQKLHLKKWNFNT